MNVKRFYAGLTGLVLAAGLAGGLAACGSTPASPNVVVNAAPPAASTSAPDTPTPTVTKTVAPASTPQIVINNNNNPAPARGRPVYVAPAPALTNCGGVYAGSSTSCPFALNVVQTYFDFGEGALSVYSPVTGMNYDMYCSGYDPTVCTGGNNALVEFYN